MTWLVRAVKFTLKSLLRGVGGGEEIPPDSGILGKSCGIQREELPVLLHDGRRHTHPTDSSES